MSVDTFATGYGQDAESDRSWQDATEEPSTEQEVAAEEPQDDRDEAGEEESGQGKGQESKRSTSRKRSGPDRGLVRRVATKVVELTTADDDDIALLAALLGASDDPVDLTVAVMTSSRGSTQALADIKTITEADEAERGVVILSMGRSRMKSVWQVLSALDVVGSTFPASDTKAAIALAKAEISDAAVARLDAVAELAKRGW